MQPRVYAQARAHITIACGRLQSSDASEDHTICTSYLRARASPERFMRPVLTSIDWQLTTSTVDALAEGSAFVGFGPPAGVCKPTALQVLKITASLAHFKDSTGGSIPRVCRWLQVKRTLQHAAENQISALRTPPYFMWEKNHRSLCGCDHTASGRLLCGCGSCMLTKLSNSLHLVPHLVYLRPVVHVLWTQYLKALLHSSPTFPAWQHILTSVAQLAGVLD